MKQKVFLIAGMTATLVCLVIVLLIAYTRPRKVYEYFPHDAQEIEYIEAGSGKNYRITDREVILNIADMLGKIEIKDTNYQNESPKLDTMIHIGYKNGDVLKAALLRFLVADDTQFYYNFQIKIGDYYYELSKEKEGEEAYNELLSYVREQVRDY